MSRWANARPLYYRVHRRPRRDRLFRPQRLCSGGRLLIRPQRARQTGRHTAAVKLGTVVVGPPATTPPTHTQASARQRQRRRQPADVSVDQWRPGLFSWGFGLPDRVRAHESCLQGRLPKRQGGDCGSRQKCGEGKGERIRSLPPMAEEDVCWWWLPRGERPERSSAIPGRVRSPQDILGCGAHISVTRKEGGQRTTKTSSDKSASVWGFQEPRRDGQAGHPLLISPALPSTTAPPPALPSQRRLIVQCPSSQPASPPGSSLLCSALLCPIQPGRRGGREENDNQEGGAAFSFGTPPV